MPKSEPILFARTLGVSDWCGRGGSSNTGDVADGRRLVLERNVLSLFRTIFFLGCPCDLVEARCFQLMEFDNGYSVRGILLQ